MQNTGKIIIIIGLIIVISGIVVYFSGNKFFSWFGHLPGDIRVERENFKLYIPITTMIIVSVILTVLMKIIEKFIE
jgi:hypothetical protein